MDLTDIICVDNIVKGLIPRENLAKFNELTQPLVEKYSKYPRVINFMKKTNDVMKNKLLDDYLIIANLFLPPCDIQSQILHHLKQSREVVSKVCECCKEDNFTLLSNGNTICKNCGLEIEFLGFTYRDQETTTTTGNPIYKKRNRFIQILNQYQGQPSKHIDEYIIEEIREWLIRNGIKDGVTRINIYQALNETGHQDLYGSIQYLFAVITGKSLTIISKANVEKLITEYDKFEEKFFGLKDDRHNMLKGNMILQRLLVRNKIDFDKEAFVELKTDERKREYEHMFRKVGI